jgi:hypothetical protein
VGWFDDDGFSAMQVEILSFRPFEKNTLRGFASVMIKPLGVVIHECALHKKGDSRWVSFPAKSPKSGGDKWYPYVEIKDREALKAFQAVALEAIDAFEHEPEETMFSDIPF